MALEPDQADAVIGPYKQIVVGLQTGGTGGPEVAEMAWAVSEMERQAALHDDVGAFVADVTNDGLYMRFNDAYSRLMAAWAEAARPEVIVLPGPMIPSDEELQDRLIMRLRGALERLSRRSDATHLIGPIQELITISQRGAPHPVVLRVMAERGLDLVPQGIVHSRAALVAEMEEAQAASDGRAEMLHALITAYDELAARSPFGVADPLAFQLRRSRIEWEHAPAIASHEALARRVAEVVRLVVDWLDAHCAFAPTDARFVSLDGDEQTQRAIEFVRDCHPGFLIVREQLLMYTWGLSFDGAVSRLAAAVGAGATDVPWSNARLELARQSRPFCVTGSAPPVPLIQAAEELHAQEATPPQVQPVPTG